MKKPVLLFARKRSIIINTVNAAALCAGSAFVNLFVEADMKKEPQIHILKSKYFDRTGDIPRQEYPRPQLRRDSYICLNGEWDFAKVCIGEKLTEYQRKILVPFSPESLLGGGDEPLDPNHRIYYKRSFTIDKSFIRNKILLHFTAVDYNSAVYVNGRLACKHLGGYLPFTADITPFAHEGENTVELTCKDPTDSGLQARGKQKLNHGGIWYTPQSGIWGDVWCESVPDGYVRDITIIPDIDHNCVRVITDTDSEKVKIEVIDDGVTIACGEGTDTYIPLPEYTLWTPEEPKLYDLIITAGEDTVTSYFGMRKFGVVTDEKGRKRLALNNRPYFHNGVLDQGYFSDGLMTAPCDEAVIDDLTLVKNLGYNMVRKHIKIEPLRFYYHCDRLGILVWQDMVNGGSKYSFGLTAALPFAGMNFKDNKYRLFGRDNAEYREQFINEAKETVNLLKNCVSLAMWVPFNEGWGQFDSDKIAETITAIDRTRTIDRASGWHDQHSGDFVSKHIYYKKISCPRDPRCFILSEFGGYSHACPEHIYRTDKFFGYKIFGSTEAMQNAFEALYEREIIPNIERGLSAAVYTQLSDIEEEINGFITYDREVVKYDAERIRKLNERVKYTEENPSEETDTENAVAEEEIDRETDTADVK